MELNQQLVFFMSLIGAFNGLLLSGYLYFAKPASLQNKMLSGLLLVISIRIAKSVWLHFSDGISYEFLQLGLSACFLIGPFLLSYVASCVYPKLPGWVKWHLTGLLAFTLVFGLLYSYSSDPGFWRGEAFRFINYSWLAYILASVWLGRDLIVKAMKEKLALPELLCVSSIVGVTLIWLAYYTSSYTSYIMGAISFSFVLYLAILILVFTRLNQSKEKYAAKKIEGSKEQSLLEKLTELMEQEALYKDANLTLAKLAQRMQINVPQLSQLLNDNLQQSFATYINQHRIEFAKSLLLENTSMTMDVVAEQSGYNSQSTFYKAFKQFQQCTPAQYRKKAADL